MPKKQYYINSAEYPQGQLGKKQKEIIKAMLPQPIWEEILEYYTLD